MTYLSAGHNHFCAMHIYIVEDGLDDDEDDEDYIFYVDNANEDE